jgi:cytosine/adenosine deaminase-related metal-dependent hydrolase
MAVRALRAAWVFPVVDQLPIAGGVVEIEGNRILAVRPYQTGEPVEDLGDVALIPGLVNAHTHLEFSGVKQPLGERLNAFPDWIRQVIALRRELDAEAGGPAAWKRNSVAAGLAESRAAGVAALGEIATSEWPEELFDSTAPQATIFAELLGMAADRQEPLWDAAKRHVASGELVELNWLPGLSPHAPYTARPALIERVCDLSAAEHFPVAMHLAESLEEIELLQSGSGPLVELLERYHAFPRDVVRRGSRPLDYLYLLSAAERALVIHGNFFAPDEIQFLGERSQRMSVAYCPRTHAYFNAGRYPLIDLLAANVNVCLGTDSRASNPDLNLFEEMRFIAHHYPEVTPDGVLYLGTQAGAEALGIDTQYGCISPGKSAELTVIELTQLSAADPHELLFADGTSSRPLTT